MLDAAAFHSGKWRTAILTEKGNPGPCGSAHEWVVSCIRITRVPVAQVWECQHCHGYMVKVPEDSVDYESKWATLTFGLR